MQDNILNDKNIETKLRIIYPILSGSFVWLIIQLTTDEPVLLRGFLHDVTQNAIAFELTRIIFKRTKPNILNFNNFKRKLGIQLLYSLIISIPILIGSYCAWKYAFTVVRPRFSDVNLTMILAQVGFAIIAISWATLIYYLYQFILHWHKTSIEKAALEKENIETRFLSLKNEINPHFLFNNLNILNGLIFENQQKASEYLLNLSDIYRYILSNNNLELIDLEKEVEILDAYFIILKNRYGNNISWDNRLSAYIIQQNKIAPLALQMLLENTVKHNIIDHNHQVQITLTELDEYFVFENNCHPKTALNSTQLGLKNIINRYRFLSDIPVIVETSKDKFTVKVPKLNQI